jgi:hypothetical protein
MKACQLCGAKSWGPVPGNLPRVISHAGQEPLAFLWDKEIEHFRRCDHCLQFAALAAIDDDPDTSTVPTLESFNPRPRPGDMLKGFLPPPAKPETRLERLLRAALDSPISRRPQDLVNYVLACEDLLEAAEKGAAAPDPVVDLSATGSAVTEGLWLHLGWRTKENFIEWFWTRLTGLESPSPADKLLTTEMRRIAEQVADQVPRD